MEQLAPDGAGDSAATNAPTQPVDDDIDSHESALEVKVRWGDELLHVAHLTPPRPFLAGNAIDADFRVDAEAIGAPRVEIPMAEGRYVHGALAFDVRQVAAARRVATSPPRLGLEPWTLASLGLHVLFIGLIGLLPPSASALSVDQLARDETYSRYLITPNSVLVDDPPEWVTPQDTSSGGKEGARERGDEGQMGDERSPKTTKHYAVQGRPDEPDPHLARDAAMDEARTGGILDVLRAATGSWNAPTSIYGRETAVGNDAISALGALLGDSPGANFGFGGLGMRGVGRHGGGTLEGTIGTGALATIGNHGRHGGPGGYGRGAGSMRQREPRVPPTPLSHIDTFGSLSKETIRRVIRRQLAQVRYCYEQELTARPDLEGRVAVKFIIAPTGLVQTAAVASSDLGVARAEQCIANVVRRMNFPPPEGGGLVIVTYPFVLQMAGQ